METCTSNSGPVGPDSHGFYGIEGVFETHLTTAEDAARFTCNPANTTEAMEGQTLSNCTEREDAYTGQSNGVVAVRMSSWGLVAAVAGAMMMIGL